MMSPECDIMHIVQSINGAVPISNSSLSLSVFVQMGQILSLGLSFKERNSAWSGLTLTTTSCMSKSLFYVLKVDRYDFPVFPCLKMGGRTTFYALSGYTFIYSPSDRSKFLKKPILLVYDGHRSHDTLKIIDLAISHGIILFCLPPHTTHMLQPLDVGVFGPFSRAWADRCDEIADDTGEEMPREDFVKEYMAVQYATFKPSTIKQMFKKSGCYPINPSVFSDEDFAPSIPTSTSANHVPPSYPVPAEDGFYITDDGNDNEVVALRTEDSDSEDESQPNAIPCNDHNNDANAKDDDTTHGSKPTSSSEGRIPPPPPPIHDPFGFLTHSPRSPSHIPVESFNAQILPPSPQPEESAVPCSSSRPRRSNKSRSSSNPNSHAQTQLERLEAHIEQLEAEAVTMQTHLSMAQDNIRDLTAVCETLGVRRFFFQKW